MNKKKLIVGLTGAVLLGVAGMFYVSQIAVTNRKAAQASTENTTKKALSDDQQYLIDHEKEIKADIYQQLDPEHQHFESLMIVTDSAEGYYDNGGDVSGNYHITFTAYANGNKDYSLEVELNFPNASIPPFTFSYPDPYRDKDQDMTEWYLSVDRGDSSEWNWLKHQEDEAKRQEDAKEAQRRAAAKRDYEAKFQKLQAWTQAHDAGLKKVISNFVAKDSEAASILGTIQTVSLNRIEKFNNYGSATLVLHLTFSNFPNDSIILELPLYFEQQNYDDVNQRAQVNIGVYDDRCWFEVLDSDSEAYKALGGEFMVRITDTSIWVD